MDQSTKQVANQEIVLTAYNEKVRVWTSEPSSKAKNSKIIRMALFEASFPGIFEKAFTRTRKLVLDEIIFKSSERGIYSAKAKTIATNCNISERTVERTIEHIKASRQYVIAYSANGRKGGYVIIDKLHEDYEKIMADIMDPDKLQKFYEAELESEHVSGLDSAEKDPQPTVKSTSEAAKVSGPSFLPDLPKEPYKHKNIKPKARYAKTALFVRLSEQLAEIFDEKEMVKVMKKVEDLRKNHEGITDDIVVGAAQATLNSTYRSFIGLFSFKIKLAIGAVPPVEVHFDAHKQVKPVPYSLSAEYSAMPENERQKVKIEQKEKEISDLEAAHEDNLKTHKQPEWLYKNKIAQAKKELAELQAELEKPSEEIDFEAKRLEFLARLGYEAAAQ